MGIIIPFRQPIAFHRMNKVQLLNEVNKWDGIDLKIGIPLMKAVYETASTNELKHAAFDVYKKLVQVKDNK